MSHFITHTISLGGGCDIAQNAVRFGLRDRSYIFDWLWNLDGGLATVQKIIANDFAGFCERENLLLSPHARWNFQQKLVHRHYPEIALIHNDITKDPQALEKLQRRAARFQEVLHGKKRGRILFVYYRMWSEPIHGVYPIDATNVGEKMDVFCEEVAAFVPFLRQRHPDLNWELLALFMTPNGEKPEITREIANRISRLQAANQHKDILTFDTVLSRDDCDAVKNQASIDDWRRVYSRYNLMINKLRVIAGKIGFPT